VIDVIGIDVIGGYKKIGTPSTLGGLRCIVMIPMVLVLYGQAQYT